MNVVTFVVFSGTQTNKMDKTTVSIMQNIVEKL